MIHKVNAAAAIASNLRIVGETKALLVSNHIGSFVSRRKQILEIEMPEKISLKGGRVNIDLGSLNISYADENGPFKNAL